MIIFESKPDTNSSTYRLSHVNEQLMQCGPDALQLISNLAEAKITELNACREHLLRRLAKIRIKCRSLLGHLQTYVGRSRGKNGGMQKGKGKECWNYREDGNPDKTA